jgi:hypothetical protein
VPGALQLADGGLAALASAGPTAGAASAAATDSRATLMEVLLLRIKAHILLAVADTNSALTVFGTAKRRLTAAAKDAGPAQQRPYQQQEAQVGVRAGPGGGRLGPCSAFPGGLWHGCPQRKWHGRSALD